MFHHRILQTMYIIYRHHMILTGEDTENGTVEPRDHIDRRFGFIGGISGVGHPTVKIGDRTQPRRTGGH